MLKPFQMKTAMKSVNYEDEADFDAASEFANFAQGAEGDGSDAEASNDSSSSGETDSDDSSDDSSSEGSVNKPIRFYFQQCYPYGNLISNGVMTGIKQLFQQSSADLGVDIDMNLLSDICTIIADYTRRCPQSIVIHLDSDLIRCGTVNTPPHLIPSELEVSVCEKSILGALRPSNIEEEEETKVVEKEHDELSKTPYVMRGQLVTNCDELWTAMKDLVYYCVADTLEIPLDTHGVIFIGSPLISRVNRSRLAQFLFRELPLPAVGFIDDIYASYVAVSPNPLQLRPAIVVHIGDTLTSVGLISGGKVISVKHSIMLTGRILTEYLMLHLKLSSINDIIAIRNTLISDISASSSSDPTVQYTTIDSKESITIDCKILHKCIDLFSDPKLFFSDCKPLIENDSNSPSKSKAKWITATVRKMPSPNLNLDSMISPENYRNYSHLKSISQMIIDCIKSDKSRIVDNTDTIDVMLCCGDMGLNGLSHRLSTDLNDKITKTKLEIKQFSQTDHCVWKGGMIAAQLPAFADQWIINKVIAKDKK